jgi:tetratricopeptide (TPR) repeat protein
MFLVKNLNRVPPGIRIVLLLGCLLLSAQPNLYCQSTDELPALKIKVGKLLKENKFTEAAPLLEKLVAAEPDDPEHHFYLGSALLGLIPNTKDAAAKVALRKRARAEFVKAKELGTSYANIDAMIESLPADGAEVAPFSRNEDVEKLMSEGEAAFSRGQLDDAFKLYQKALAADPKQYHAALFSGDVKMQQNNFEQAEVWYQRAILIDPEKETAYRYSATPLMKQKKYDDALKRYIEAYITEPYNRFTTGGLVQWSQITNRTLAHPQIDIPSNVEFDEKGDAKINLDMGSLMNGKDDGSFAWISYGATRSLWHKEKFRKTYPNEPEYRHSLAEEADAIRSVLATATAKSSSGKAAQLSPSLQKLKKLDDEGLLEAYILLARPDRQIAQDHLAYLRTNRDKLRRYVTDYVAKGGGN